MGVIGEALDEIDAAGRALQLDAAGKACWLPLLDLDLVGRCPVALVVDPAEETVMAHACKTVRVHRVELRPLGVRRLLPLADDELEDAPPDDFASKYLIGPKPLPRRPVRVAALRRLREYLPGRLERETLECATPLVLPRSAAILRAVQKRAVTCDGRRGEVAVHAMVRTGRRHYAKVRLIWAKSLDRELEEANMFFELAVGEPSRLVPIAEDARSEAEALFERPLARRRRA
jgi:hypothetical protein